MIERLSDGKMSLHNPDGLKQYELACSPLLLAAQRQDEKTPTRLNVFVTEVYSETDMELPERRDIVFQSVSSGSGPECPPTLIGKARNTSTMSSNIERAESCLRHECRSGCIPTCHIGVVRRMEKRQAKPLRPLDQNSFPSRPTDPSCTAL